MDSNFKLEDEISKNSKSKSLLNVSPKAAPKSENWREKLAKNLPPAWLQERVTDWAEDEEPNPKDEREFIQQSH